MSASHNPDDSKEEKEISLKGNFVPQGNGNGKSIALGSEDILHTSDLVDCIAVLIVGNGNCYMIHSDSNEAKGVGSISFAQGIKNLGLPTEASYQVGLIGGMSEVALLHKKKMLETILPNARITMMKPNVDSAYLLGNGLMAESKRIIKEALKVDILKIEESTHSPRMRF